MVAGAMLWGSGCGSSTSAPNPSTPQEVSPPPHSDTLPADQNSPFEPGIQAKGPERLPGLPENIDLSAIYELKTVSFGKYTGLYDKDKDGRLDTLNVYLKPMDQDGDIFKAAGVVEVELWNLDPDQTQALLARWRVESAELRKRWFASLLTVNYRLSFKLPRFASELDSSLTVKCRFTDLLSGQPFTIQQMAVRH